MKNNSKLYLDVRSLVISYSRGFGFTKELLASKFKVEQHEIAQILHTLNLEGWVTKPIHHDPIKWSGSRHADPYHPDVYLRTDKPIKLCKPLRDLDQQALQSFIGQKVRKVSGKPFKSRFLEATVERVVLHPFTNRPAFLLVEDQTVVEAGQCELSDEAQ